MATGVGLRIAEDECLAAIVTTGGGSGALLPQPPLFIVREPILYMSDDGDTDLGGDPPAGNTHSITGFVSAVGDPAGIPVDDGEAYRAEDLLATALFCLIDLAAEHLAGPAEFYAVHPAHWPAAQVLALRDALDYLGLRSVVLVSEAILPDAATGREYASAAARGALAAVLSTPAGATPPDPTRAENPMESTDVLPALSTPEHAQAYSAAIPVEDVARLVAAQGTVAPADAESLEPTATTAAPTVVPPTPRRRTPMLIAAAAALGLLLGGTGVGFVLSSHSTTPAPSTPDAHSDFTPTTIPTTIPLPPPPVVTRRPAPIPVVPRQPAQRTEAPPPPPRTTTPAPTTLPTTTPGTPTTTPNTTDPYWYPYPTTHQSPYQPFTGDPFAPNTLSPYLPPNVPTGPGLGYPSAGTQGDY